jgi:hypothetical protein
MKRSDLLQLIEASLAAGQYLYARDTAALYLADWPGDLAVQALLGRAFAAEGNAARAGDVLAAVVAADPEDAVAQRAYGDQHAALGNRAGASHAHACAHVVDGHGVPGGVPAWAAAARTAFLAEKTGDWQIAQQESLNTLRDEPPGPLASLVHLAALWHAGLMDLARPLAEGFHAQWPSVVAFKLCLAECLLAAGERVRAIELLHAAAAEDQGGQVVSRHWGANHPYRSLWEVEVDAKLSRPIPGAVAAVLGLNQLSGRTNGAGPSESQAADKSQLPDELADIQAQLDRVAARLPSKEALKYRFSRMKSGPGAAASNGEGAPAPRPHYVILSSRTRLLQVFGEDGFAQVEAALKSLAASANRRPGWKCVRLYVDDPTTLAAFGLRPVNPANAFEVKTLVGKLAERLGEQHSTLGALLIIGGANIVPFHHLPNPTDDVDGDIPSDNPYATADDNYFVPEWPVGRLPTGAGADPALLVRAIRAAAGATHTPLGPGYRAWLERLRRWLRQQWLARAGTHSFGYSANVWKSASAAVYNQIGDPRDLLTSPPLDANALPIDGLAPSRLSYFNLHGIEDGPEWYGQRSFEDPGTVPEYPVALRPADVANSGRAPVVVFSEACYGANILDKDVEAALCLKFLASGTRVMVGSTKIAYGSVTTPLVGADLLGRFFWQNMNAGLPAGEALRRAKLQMAQEMNNRQGFLDGEDQKTLISFVLYGDPLAAAPLRTSPGKRLAKPLPLPKLSASLATVCDRSTTAGLGDELAVTPEMVAQIKGVVAQYLPGMSDAALRITHSHALCHGGDHLCPTAQLGKLGKNKAAASPHTTVVTLSKTFRVQARAHPHYARVTLDAHGAVVKLAVSR